MWREPREADRPQEPSLNPAESRMLSRAVAQSGEGVLIVGLDRRVVYANPSLCKMAGTTAERLQGSPALQLFPEPYRRPLEAILAGRGRGNWTGEFEFLSQGGGRTPVLLTVGGLSDEGHETGHLLTLMDLTSVKRAEERLTYRLALESVIGLVAARLAAADGGSVAGELIHGLRRMAGTVGADRAYLFRMITPGIISTTHEWCDRPEPSRRQVLALADYPWLAARLDARAPIVIDDTGDLPSEAGNERAMWRAQGCVSVLIVPMSWRDTLFGLIGFEARHRREWATEDIQMLRAGGEIIANTLMRLEAEAAVRSSQESLAYAQRVARLGNWEWRAVSGEFHLSDEVYRLLGEESPSGPAIGFESFLASVHPADRAGVEQARRQASERALDYEIDYRIPRRDGSIRIVHERAVAERDAQGRLLRVVGTVQDVTEARRAEGELKRLNRSLRTLSRGNEILVRASEERQLLKDICGVLVEMSGYRLAWVGYPSEGREGIDVVAWAGRDGSPSEGPLREGGNPAGKAIGTREPCIVRDADDGRCPMPPGRDGAALIALPLVSGEEAIGALCIHACDRDAFDSEEVRLLTEFANDLAYGIAALRSRRLREQTERDLERSEKRYHSLFENAPNAYLSVSAVDGAVVQCNAALVDLLGYGRGEIAGMRLFDLFPPGSEGVDKAREIVAGGRTVRNAELAMRRKDGSLLWTSVSVDPAVSERGRVAESRWGITDLSERKRVEEERLRMGRQLERALVQTIQAIAVTVEKRDPYTAGHQQRVAELAVAIGREMGLPGERLEGLRLGSLIHDIGKIYVPAEFLNRPGVLSPIELKIIRSHALMGHDVIKRIEFPWPVADIVVQHHERLDGSGHPYGLSGDQILLESRILAVADVVEAMASHRPYRPALPLDVALAEIERNKESAYDPAVVDVCQRLFREHRFHWESQPRAN